MKQTHQPVKTAHRLARFLVFAILLVGMLGWGGSPGAQSPRPEMVMAAGDPVIAAAGDIACDPGEANFNGGSGTANNCRAKYTSNLLVNAGLAAVLALGDNQYYCGGYQAFLQSYALSWGRVKSITHPVVGNHEYLTYGGTGCDITNEAAAGYYRYFGAAAGDPTKGYYSFDIGAWHLIALNSNCTDAGGCGPTSPQGKWLEADLDAHSNACVLAYWHIPLFSSGGRAASNSRPFWQALYNHDADLILAGHDHIYERFAPQTPSGVLDLARGIRQFTVGTGGNNHTSITTVAANSELIDTSTYGVLKLTLHPTSYDWQFVPEAGGSFSESGTQACHGQGAGVIDATPPTVPGSLKAATVTQTQVGLTWKASTDNVGVTGYKIFRNGAQIATTSAANYTDGAVKAVTRYSYTVSAYDAAGNNSSLTNPLQVTTPPYRVTLPLIHGGQ